MKKIVHKMAVLMALVLPLHSIAQSVQENCDAVNQAAVAGRDAANNRIAQNEATVRTQVASARNCLEQFGDAASRQAIVIGGFDLTPLRNTLMNQACSVIQGAVANAQGQLSSVGSQATALQQAWNSQNPGASVATPAPAPATSIFDRVACRLNGTC